MNEFSRLPGLPPYGELARPFPPEWGRFGREGVVVRFVRSDGGIWAGNFAPGIGGATDVRAHPDEQRVIVFAGGDVWVVDPDTESAEQVAVAVDAIWPVEGPAGMVMSRQGLAFSRLGPAGLLWHTRRLSWDGFDQVRLAEGRLTGLAWDAVHDRWEPFAVDLSTGRSTGGTFSDDDHEGWERLAG